MARQDRLDGIELLEKFRFELDLSEAKFRNLLPKTRHLCVDYGLVSIEGGLALI